MKSRPRAHRRSDRAGLARLLLAIGAAVALTPAAARADWPEGGIVLATSTDFRWSSFRLWRDPASGLLTVHYGRQSPSGWSANTNTVSAEGTVVSSGGLPATNGLAPDGFGGLFAVRQLSGYGQVGLQRVDASGGTHPSSSGFWEVTPQGLESTVAADGGGGCYVSWTVASPLGLRLRRMNPDGTGHSAWPQAGVLVHTKSFFSALLPDAAGGVFVADGWAAENEAHTLHRRTATGAVALGWPAGGVVLGVTGVVRRPTLMITGDAVIAGWTSVASSRPLMLQRVLQSGVADPAWPAGGLMIAANDVPFHLAPDGLGGAYVGWKDAGGVRLTRILANGSAAPGFPAGGINPLDSGAQLLAGADFAIAAGPDHGVVVAWEDSRNSTATCRIRWLQADGTPRPGEAEPARSFEHDADGDLNSLAMVSDGGTAWVLHSGFRVLPLAESMGTYRCALLSRLEAPTTVGVPDAPGGGLTLAAWPNPARTEIQVRFALAAGEDAALLEMFDVSGREVASRAVRGPGGHVERFAALERLDPGLYFVRLSAGPARRVARIVLTR